MKWEAEVNGDLQSGNCYKIKLLMEFLNIEHEWLHVDILQGASQADEFKQMNPNGKIPVLALSNNSYLYESNAILNYLASGTSLLPDNKFQQAQVLQWQFFEQYSHEPFIAVARYINKYLHLPDERLAEYQSKQEGGHKALRVMEQQLGLTLYLVGSQLTIADISLYAYTHVAHEGGFNLAQYPNIQRWLKRIESQPHYIGM